MASDGEGRDSVSARRAWQGQGSAREAETRGARRRVKIVVVTGVLAALAALGLVLLGYIGLPAPAPQFLAINVAEHNHKQFPLEAFARADSEILMRHFEDGKKKEATTRSKELLRAELAALKDRPAQPLVIHLTALALVRGETVYLLPADAEPDNEATWLNVDEVLQAVEKCPAKDNLLLILDLAHGLIEPRLGVCTDRVAEALEAAFRKKETSFLVLCPCSAGQSSLTSEVLRSSVLAFYLDQGLLGEADIDQNGSVSARELVKFVQPRVDRWARTNLGVRQEPRLFGKGADFIVAPLGRPVLEKRPPVALDPYPETLLKAWKKHDEAWDRGAFRQASRPLLRLEANLLRDEMRWRGGGAGKELLDQETRNLITELGRLLAAPAAAPRLASVEAAQENPAAVDALFHVLRRIMDVKKAQEESVKILQKDKNADYAQQTRAVVDALSRLPELKQEQLKTAQGILAGLKGNEPFVETLYIDRLAAFAEREFPETFQKAKVEIVWRTMRAHETVLAALAREPEFLPWVAPALEKADKDRHAAEGRLLWERPPAWPEALRDLQSSADSYDLLKKTLDGMRTGSAALDRALAELPIHLRILCEGPDADRQAEATWFKAAEEAAYLQKFFVAPPDGRETGAAKLDTHGRDLQQHLDELMQSLRARLKSAENIDTGTALRQADCLLQNPRLSAAERAGLVSRSRETAKKLQEATETSDQPAPKAAESIAGLVRARMSLTLLRMADIGPESPEFVLPAPLELGGLPAAEKRLHALWGADGLCKRWREAPHDRRGQIISRLVSAWDLQMQDEDHTRLWQAKLREEHLRWLKAQYERESRETGPRTRKKGDDRDQAARDFYRDAAQ